MSIAATIKTLGLGLLLLGLATGCTRPVPDQTSPVAMAAVTAVSPTVTLAATVPPATATAVSAIPTPQPPTPTPIPPTATPPPDERCGQILPILTTSAASVTASLNADPAAVASLRASVPTAALPALNFLLAQPENVGLAAYRLGQSDNGAYLNADVPMPLASVVKIIHLVAYAEAVTNGQLNPTETIPLAALDAYYQPNLDLRGHTNAIAGLEDNGRLFGNPPSLLLDEVPGMMIRYSSNAATDYLHMRLGQRVIEETAVSLNLTSQTAPCPFLGQFLAMGNHTRTTSDQLAIENYIANPITYAVEVMQLTTAYSTDPDFRAAAIAWRDETRRPTGQNQRLFSHTLNAQGSPRDYASLMARLATNGLTTPDSSYTARRFLEWPMIYPVNQNLFSNLGYKGGSLPGILTTAYYAYPLGDTTPIVVTLFFHDLPGDTYREWRNTQAHDELARWLLSDPNAISQLRAILP